MDIPSHVSVPEYEPAQFKALFESEIGSPLWAFMNEPDNVLRMETASYLNRPAVEPLSPGLVERFGREAVAQDRTKMMIGHMTKQIMQRRGYEHAAYDGRIRAEGNVFKFGSKYRKKA
jgi:hypothetical protein